MPCLNSTTALRSGLVALALLFAGLAGAPAATASSAQEFPVGGAAFQRAVDVARAYWGAAPCRGEITYAWQGLEPLTNARASWSNPTDAWNNAGANFNCQVVFNTLTQYDFSMLCTVMAHELGHLLGRPHADRDGHLMSAIYSAPLPECGGAPAPASETDGQEESDGEPVAWSVSDEPGAAKRKTAGKARAARRRCVVRVTAGKRVRRCIVLKRPSRKARAAGHERQARRYTAR